MAKHRVVRRVIVLRHPARAVRIAAALRSAGMTAYSLPLTDTELPTDVDAAGRELRALGRGAFGWIVVTSGNTVQALGMLAGAEGASLGGLVVSGGVKVAAVGSATARLLADAGVVVDLLPGEASSAGLLGEFPPGSGAILLPQADLAPGDLQTGLSRLGWSVRRIDAYRTVPYPADPARRVPGVEEQGTQPPLLSPSDVMLLASTGVQPAVVFTAPSTVRQFREKLGGPLEFLPVAIGRTTAAALRSQGWEPAATAPDPTPHGIARAVGEAFLRASGHAVPDPARTPLNGDQP